MMDLADACPDKVKVFCDIKVMASSSASKESMNYSDEQNLMILTPESWPPGHSMASKSSSEKRKKEISYAFERIYVNRPSHQLYSQVVYPALKHLFFEENALLLVHGTANSNKKKLLHGDPLRSTEAGMFKRILETLFCSISDCQNSKYLLKSTGPNNKFVLQDTTRIQFDQLLEKKFKQHPYRGHLRSKFNTADSSLKSMKSDYLFVVPLNCQEDQGTSRYSVFLSCMELHNDVLYDLLDPFNPANKTDQSAKLKTHEKKVIDMKRGTARLKNLSQIDKSEIEVTSVSEALELIHDANCLRFVDFNDASKTRSHFIVEFKLVKIETSKTTGSIEFKVTQMCVVDLAACDKMMEESNAVHRAREKQYLNASLLSLRTCLESVKFNSLYPFYKKPVKTNESILTSLLDSYFQTMDDPVRMLLCINSDNSNFNDNCNVLKFANLVSKSFASTPMIPSYSSAMSAACLTVSHPTTGMILTPVVPSKLPSAATNSNSQVDSRPVANQTSKPSQAGGSSLNDMISFPDATAASKVRYTVSVSDSTENDAESLDLKELNKIEESYSSIVSSVKNFDAHEEHSLSNLIKVLVNHQSYRGSMVKRMGDMVNRVRSELKEILEQHEYLKNDASSCKSALSKLESRIERDEKKLNLLKSEVNRMTTMGGHSSRVVAGGGSGGFKPPPRSFEAVAVPTIVINNNDNNKTYLVQSKHDTNNNEDVCCNLNYNLNSGPSPYIADLETESDDKCSSSSGGGMYEHVTYRSKSIRRSRSAGVKSRVDMESEPRYEHIYSNDTNLMGIFSPKTRAQLLKR